MSILDNDLTIYEQFRTFFPQWLLEFYEFDEILKREASAAEKMQSVLDLLIDNHFMDCMDEDTIFQFEKFLEITPTSNDLEFRRNLIKAHYLGRGKLSMSQIISTVEILSGGNCKGIFEPIDEDGNNGITLTISDSDIRGALVDILKVLLERIPAHLFFEIIYEPAIIKRNVKGYVNISQRIDSVLSTGGTRIEKVECGPKVFVNTSQYSDNTIVAQMLIYDGGGLTDDIENVIDGGDSMSPLPTDILDFNY